MMDLPKIHRKIVLQGAENTFEWLLFLFLVPFSIVYGFIGWVRYRCYCWGVFPSYRAAVPVISVGNLAVGGTGKTPVVDWLIKDFINQGKVPAVVSRGYGGSYHGSVAIVSKGAGILLNADEAGDEPYLLARRNSQCHVLIARKRAAGVRLAIEELGADIIILDDGFQHHAVERDIDLVLLDATAPFGNGWPLPAGLLREFPAALKRADQLMLTRSSDASNFNYADLPVFNSKHQLVDTAVSLTGETVPLQKFKDLKLFAFAGIADPTGFFAALTATGLHLAGQLSLSDHCRYDQSLLTEIERLACGFDALLTTEKDAVKLTAGMFAIPCYQVPMQIVIENEAAFKGLLQKKLWS